LTEQIRLIRNDAIGLESAPDLGAVVGVSPTTFAHCPRVCLPVRPTPTIGVKSTGANTGTVSFVFRTVLERLVSFRRPTVFNDGTRSEPPTACLNVRSFSNSRPQSTLPVASSRRCESSFVSTDKGRLVGGGFGTFAVTMRTSIPDALAILCLDCILTYS
jgi:hypothetical protein